MMRNRQALGCLAALLALVGLALPGCGRPSGSVSGKVTFKGQPVSGGTVTFLGADDKAAWSPIEADGSYTVTKVAIGTAKIGVSPPVSSAMPKGMKMDAGKMGAPAPEASAASGKPPSIPEQYQDPTRSGLTCDVKVGAQDHNIELK